MFESREHKTARNYILQFEIYVRVIANGMNQKKGVMSLSLSFIIVNYVPFRRVHLLRPYTRVESIQMPTAIEQRGIHLVLPVTKDDTHRLDEFLQMYQRVCLQTGENVVLLTVFVNVRDGAGENLGELYFAGGKALIAR